MLHLPDSTVCHDAIWIMETVLAGFALCMIYPDYILVLGDTLDKHLQALTEPSSGVWLS